MTKMVKYTAICKEWKLIKSSSSSAVENTENYPTEGFS